MPEEEGLDPEDIYGNDYVDVTDSVQCYEKGKTFKCDCGQGFGVQFGDTGVTCPTCGSVCVDTEADERKPPEREEGQSSLTDW